MEDMCPLEVNSGTLPPASSGDINPPSIGANRTVTLKPGETLILYHPSSLAVPNAHHSYCGPPWSNRTYHLARHQEAGR